MRSLFEISKSGLRSAERSLSVTSNNIINADTPGYTRQRLDRTPNGMDMSGYNTGLGVNVGNVQRLRDEMNDVLLNQKRQDMSFMQNKATVFEQLEASMVSDTGLDLDYSISSLLDAFSDLSTDPQDISVRNSLISEAQQMSDKFADISRNMTRTSDLTRDSANQTIGKVNDLLKEVEGLNHAITQGEGAGQPDNMSLDLRVQKLEELAELINFETHEIDFGAVEIRVNGIKILGIDGAAKLTPEVNDVDKEFRVRIDSGKTLDVTGGQLGAEIEMYQKDIPELKDRLDLLASTIVEEVNNIHSQGYGLDDATQRNFFDPNFNTADDLRLNVAILGNPNHIASSTNPGEAGNGELAAQIAALRNEEVIGGRKLVDYSIDLVSTPGTKLRGLNSRIEARDSEISMLETQQEQEAGVNVDEELSLMIQYQNAYQGAAKVMQAAQQMYDTLLTIL
jgi:flagellar hook-associated protein 1 FlgK